MLCTDTIFYNRYILRPDRFIAYVNSTFCLKNIIRLIGSRYCVSILFFYISRIAQRNIGPFYRHLIGTYRTQIQYIGSNAAQVDRRRAIKAIDGSVCHFTCGSMQAANVDSRTLTKQNAVGIEQKDVDALSVQSAVNLTFSITGNIVQHISHIFKVDCFTIGDIELFPFYRYVITACTDDIHNITAAADIAITAAAHYCAALRQSVSTADKHPADNQG